MLPEPPVSSCNAGAPAAVVVIEVPPMLATASLSFHWITSWSPFLIPATNWGSTSRSGLTPAKPLSPAKILVTLNAALLALKAKSFTVASLPV